MSHMDLYGVIITLQEASRFLKANCLEMADFEIRLAISELDKLAKRDKEKREKDRRAEA